MFFDMAKLFHFFTAKENQGQDSMFNAILMSVCHVDKPAETHPLHCQSYSSK